jgi:hypothetical protein
MEGAVLGGFISDPQVGEVVLVRTKIEGLSADCPSAYQWRWMYAADIRNIEDLRADYFEGHRVPQERPNFPVYKIEPPPTPISLSSDVRHWKEVFGPERNRQKKEKAIVRIVGYRAAGNNAGSVEWDVILQGQSEVVTISHNELCTRNLPLFLDYMSDLMAVDEPEIK